MQGNEGKALAVTERAGELAARSGGENPVAAMLAAVIEKGLTAENAEAAEKICDLYLKVEALGARKLFAAAKAALQAELPPVVATNPVKNKDGTERYTYAGYDEIMAVVQPLLVKHGFSVSFTTRVDEKRMAAICTLSHVGGHSESNEFAVRTSGGPPGCSDAQADGSNLTYARRYALCLALNITIDKDNDARIEGGVVSAEVAKELEDRVRATKSDPVKFLKVAEAESFATIRDGKVDMLRDLLARKEGKQLLAQGKTATDEPPATPGTGTLPY